MAGRCASRPVGAIRCNIGASCEPEGASALRAVLCNRALSTTPDWVRARAASRARQVACKSGPHATSGGGRKRLAPQRSGARSKANVCPWRTLRDPRSGLLPTATSARYCKVRYPLIYWFLVQRAACRAQVGPNNGRFGHTLLRCPYWPCQLCEFDLGYGRQARAACGASEARNATLLIVRSWAPSAWQVLGVAG